MRLRFAGQSILRSIAFQRTLQLLQGRKKKKIKNGQEKFYFKTWFNPIRKLLLVNKQQRKKKKKKKKKEKNLRLVKGVEEGKGGGGYFMTLVIEVQKPFITRDISSLQCCFFVTQKLMLTQAGQFTHTSNIIHECFHFINSSFLARAPVY